MHSSLRISVPAYRPPSPARKAKEAESRARPPEETAKQATRWAFAVFALLAGCGGRGATATPAQAPTASAVAPASGASESKTAYSVHIDVTEGQNRVVEGRVRDHLIRIDQPKAFGGDDTAPTPPETLAFALGSCVVSTGRLISQTKHLPVKTLSATVEGELDFARALGMGQAKRAGFGELRVVVQVEAEMSAEQKHELFRDIIARCPMCDNLASTTPLRYELAP